MSLFDPAGDLNIGKWRCPMFKCPTQLGKDIETIGQEPSYSGLDLCIRIGYPGNAKDMAFNSDAAVLSHYKLAHYHAEPSGAGNLSMSQVLPSAPGSLQPTPGRNNENYPPVVVHPQTP